MPLPARLARFNRRVVNPVARTISGRVPPFAVVEHRGRRSGRAYRTPVWAFGSGVDLVIALTYGSGADWVRNVLAQGGCTLVRRGRRIACRDPRLVGAAEGLPLLPAVIRPAVRLLGVAEFLALEPASTEQEARG